MLKFVSANENNFEDTLTQELNIPKSNKINEFLSTVQSENLIASLKQSADKNDYKDPTKIQEFIKSKLIILISIFTTHKSFYMDDTQTRKSFNNLLLIIQNLSKENKFLYLNYLSDFYQLIPNNNSEFKQNLLLSILNLINEESDLTLANNLFRSIQIEEILNDFSERFNENVEVYSGLGKVLSKLRNFEILNRLRNNNFIMTAIFREEDKLTKESLRILFYYLYNKVNLNNKIYQRLFEVFNDNKDVADELVNEKILVCADSLDELKKVEENSFDQVYGLDSGERFILNAKLRFIYKTLSNISENNLTFEKLESQYGLNLEDLEEVVSIAQELNLFKIVIDYELNLIRIRYVRRSQFTEEVKTQMKNRCNNLREKLRGMVKKIDYLITSE